MVQYSILDTVRCFVDIVSESSGLVNAVGLLSKAVACPPEEIALDQTGSIKSRSAGTGGSPGADFERKRATR